MDDTDESGFPPTIRPNALEENVIKILLATDNHVGYLERDPIRGQDSINTFKEILELAVKHEVDLVLLGGDLFHDNRPSRDTLYQVMSLLREYCLGDRPIQIELLSDPNEGKVPNTSFPAINYEDPNLNISLPVFSIHGNHDDPQGAGAAGALGALDLLSVSGLINYMGKFDLPYSDSEAKEEGIAVRPVLLQKGTTRLAMYGIGNVKDQRMHFELRSNRVRMYMPKDRDDWFNILVVHQNRVNHGPQKSVPEGMFDDSVDLVVWGHEHDCRIIPETVPGKKYRITQPGSSVATSLADGESLEKHVALIHVHGKEYSLKPLPLRTARPFVLEEVVLSEVAEEEGFELEDQMEIAKYLRSRVNALIEKANASWDERNTEAFRRGEAELPQMLPLIRLKVDTTGVNSLSNPIRFGQEFQGKIANPRDVLVFHRAKKAASRSKVVVEQPELSIDDPELTLAEKISKLRVQTLVREFLGAQELQLLGEVAMSSAIETFVEKDDTHAIQNHVASSLKKMVKNVQITGESIDEDDLDEAVARAREQHEKESTEAPKKESKGKNKARDDDEGSVDSMEVDVDIQGSDFEEEEEAPLLKPKRATTSRTTTAKGKKKAQKSDSEDYEEEEEEEPAPKKKTTTRAKKEPAKKAPAPKKPPARGGRSKRAVEEESEDEEEIIEIEPPKKKGRTAVLSQPVTTTKKTPAKKAPASGTKQGTLSFAPSGRKPRGAARD
ncbi:Metallo-dependent phosphatase-like protein [Thelephora terrestris]|uniref:Double-strand break repair protein n=1 Tax=Thelephora terrestris TaxID=56493 RepID=A0A9P6H9Z1_9AGAM|nr:Metallo-dependent phosphatase-like protein [Thelephora terrestris]